MAELAVAVSSEPLRADAILDAHIARHADDELDGWPTRRAARLAAAAHRRGHGPARDRALVVEVEPGLFRLRHDLVSDAVLRRVNEPHNKPCCTPSSRR